MIIACKWKNDKISYGGLMGCCTHLIKKKKKISYAKEAA